MKQETKPDTQNQEFIQVAVLPYSNTVLFPGINLTLKIKDQYYIKMVEESIKLNRPIAVCLSKEVKIPNTKRVVVRSSQVAGAGYPQILMKDKDGSLKILIKGIHKVKLKKEIQKYPYNIYQAEIIDSTNRNPFILKDYFIKKLRHIYKKWILTNYLDETDQIKLFIKGENEKDLINYMSMFCIKDHSLKQKLLEITDQVEIILSLYMIFKPNTAVINPNAVKVLKSF